MQSDRHLLLGLLALQCGFITKDQLVAAFSDWTSNKARSLEQILTENQAITPQQRSLLAALVEEHLKQHGNDPEMSLAALSSLPPITHDLRQLADPDLNASLNAVRLKELEKPLATTAILANPHARSSRFIILRKHAKGGLGQVSVALDSELNRHVALKEMLGKWADDPASQQRFVQEAEITGQLEHPGIVPVYGLGTYGDGKPYYAMRFVEGDNLKRAVEKFHKERSPHEQLTGPRAVEFRNLLGRFVDVCNAIEYAHSRKVLHRDLKPDNILLGPYGETLVVDWGLAKALGRNEEPEENARVRPVKPRSGTHGETVEGSAIGTPAYMSPEQAEGKLQSLGPATDVYSLGATLYALLTGAPPAQGDTAVDTLEKVRRGDIERPRKLWTSVPKPLEAVCLKAMSLAPADRYPSAKILADEIEKWLADEPVEAFQEPITVRARRWIKRHPAFVSTTVASMVLTLAAAIVVVLLQTAHTKQLGDKNKTITDQVVELTKRNEQVEKERGRAQEREKDAIAAVKRFGDAVAANSELKNSPKMESLRRDLLKEPVHFFQLLRKRLQESSETDPDSLAQLASASFDLGRLTNEIGDIQNAIAAYQESLAIMDRLAREHRSKTLYQSALSNTHHNMGDLYRQTGKQVEALAAYEQAKAIRERLGKENPTIPEFQRDWAVNHISLGVVLRQIGKPVEALASFQRAIEIQDKLVRDYPTVIEYQSGLAQSQNNYGALLNENGRLPEALAAFQKANSIFQQLMREKPSNISFQKDLAASHSNMGMLLSGVGTPALALGHFLQAKELQERLTQENATDNRIQYELSVTCGNMGALHYSAGNSAEAQKAFEQAKAIQERLVRENPSAVQYQNDLARSCSTIGLLLNDAGNRSKALEAYAQAKTIQERLVRENPSIPDFQSDLGGTLNNLAMVHLDLRDYAQARDLFREAIQHQKGALATNLAHATYREYLRNHYSELLKAAAGLQDAALAQEAERGLLELAISDPQLAALDARLAAVLSGAESKDASELASFGQRSYDLRRFAQATQFFEDAIKQDASLANSRESQILYNAACCAALAASGQGDANPPLDVDANSKLRTKALHWLRQELTTWEKAVNDNSKPSFLKSLIVGDTKSQTRELVGQTLAHWQKDSDLASIRDLEKLAALPEAERKDWETLWTQVKDLHAKASVESTSTTPEVKGAGSF